MVDSVEVFEQIVAQSFVVPDAAGQPRIVLGLDAEEGDAPFVRLFRADGAAAATFHCDSDGNVMLAMIDPAGGWRLSVRVTGNGVPDVSLFDGDLEQPRITLVMEPDIEGVNGERFSGRAAVRVNGRDEEAHAELWVTNDDDGDLVLLNSNGAGNSYGPPRGAKPGDRF
jgi:hypothetical protein